MAALLWQTHVLLCCCSMTSGLGRESRWVKAIQSSACFPASSFETVTCHTQEFWKIERSADPGHGFLFHFYPPLTENKLEHSGGLLQLQETCTFTSH